MLLERRWGNEHKRISYKNIQRTFNLVFVECYSSAFISLDGMAMTELVWYYIPSDKIIQWGMLDACFFGLVKYDHWDQFILLGEL